MYWNFNQNDDIKDLFYISIKNYKFVMDLMIRLNRSNPLMWFIAVWVGLDLTWKYVFFLTQFKQLKLY